MIHVNAILLLPSLAFNYNGILLNIIILTTIYISMGATNPTNSKPQEIKLQKLTLASHQIGFIEEQKSISKTQKIKSEQNKENCSNNTKFVYQGFNTDEFDFVSMETPRFKSIIQQNIYNFRWDHTSSNAKHYAIQGRVVKFTGKDQHPYQLIDRNPLPSKGVFPIGFRIRRYGADSCISFGVTTEYDSNNPCCCRSEQTITFMSYPSGKADFFKGGRNMMIKRCRRQKIGIEKQGQIVFIVDATNKCLTIERKVNQYQKQSLSQSISFDNHFGAKQLYVFVCMSSQGDIVQCI